MTYYSRSQNGEDNQLFPGKASTQSTLNLPSMHSTQGFQSNLSTGSVQSNLSTGRVQSNLSTGRVQSNLSTGSVKNTLSTVSVQKTLSSVSFNNTLSTMSVGNMKTTQSVPISPTKESKSSTKRPEVLNIKQIASLTGNQNFLNNPGNKRKKRGTEGFIDRNHESKHSLPGLPSNQTVLGTQSNLSNEGNLLIPESKPNLYTVICTQTGWMEKAGNEIKPINLSDSRLKCLGDVSILYILLILLCITQSYFREV